MNNIFSQYLSAWQNTSSQQRIARTASLFNDGKSLVEHSLKAQGILPTIACERKIAIARRMYIGDPDTLQLIDSYEKSILK